MQDQVYILLLSFSINLGNSITLVFISTMSPLLKPDPTFEEPAKLQFAVVMLLKTPYSSKATELSALQSVLLYGGTLLLSQCRIFPIFGGTTVSSRNWDSVSALFPTMT